MLWKKLHNTTPQEILDYLGINEVPVPVQEIVLKLGITLKDIQTNADMEVVSTLDSDNPTLTIHQQMNPSLKNFLIATGLAFFIYGEVGNTYRRTNPDMRVGAFPSLLLMPAEWVSLYGRHYRYNLGEMAKAFGVTREQMGSRFVYLKSCGRL